MKQIFTDRLKLNSKNKQQLDIVKQIIEEYSTKGYIMTLRQLFYQLVSRGIIQNSKKEYDKLCHILVQGRMAGVVDWDAIEDRIRVPFIPYSVIDTADAIADTIKQYRLDRMQDQDVYIEIWVEKDALSGVLKPITSHYHVNLMVNRGYSSCTAMHDAFERIKRQQDAKRCIILYLGDHDPSGVDMVRDIEARLKEFGTRAEIIKLALTQEQITKYNPPPYLAKKKDPRAKDYISKFGNTSWEVDALNPDVLHSTIRRAVEELIDIDKFNAKIEQEEKDKKQLEDYAKGAIK